MQKNINIININHFISLVPSFMLIVTMSKSYITLSIEKDYIYLIILFFKRYTNTQFNYLSDICGIDFPQKTSRFEIVYNLLSLPFNARLRIKTSIHELMSLNSLTLIFLSASWFERELWDMLGIYFFEHFRLRRILTDYGFFGYPLRKEFPTSGFLEIRYNEQLQKISYEKIQFAFSSRFLNNLC